jgi:hypothetical protein
MALRPHLVALLLALALAAPALAQQRSQQAQIDEELRRLQTVLNILNQELAAEYRHVDSLQQALQDNARLPLAGDAARSPDVVSFEDVAAQKRAALRREADLNARLDAVYARIRQLDAQKQPLLSRLSELIGSVGAAATAGEAGTAGAAAAPQAGIAAPAGEPAAAPVWTAPAAEPALPITPPRRPAPRY